MGNKKSRGLKENVMTYKILFMNLYNQYFLLIDFKRFVKFERTTWI